ncbi:MAG TPA: lytic murein transglycosylase, partial [Pseudonocardiaceae bacterium]|nr:lytic murein transglycosylase [Pseudonocardiaceae bacterium]
MTDPDSQEHQPEARPPMGYRRTRLAVALIGLMLGVGVPVVVLTTPAPTVNGQVVNPRTDLAAIGITEALPGGPLPGGPVATDPQPSPTPTAAPDFVLGDPASIGLPGIPTPPNLPDGPLGIPGVALDAYQFAERTLVTARPGCHLSWSLLAGIGRIESNHASDGRVDAFGNTLGPILGAQLNGSPGVAAIPDTDHGVLDQDTTWDRAVGPMQFIPSSWRTWGVDGNGDGVANPNNIYDSTVAAGLYLCNGGVNLSDPAQQQAAVFRYNHSATYVDLVLQWAHAYLTGVVPIPSAPGPVPQGTDDNGDLPGLPDTSPLAVAAHVATQVATEVATLTPTPTPTPATSPAPPSETTALPPTPTSEPSPTPTTSPSPTTETTSSSPSPDPSAATPTPTGTSSPLPVEPGST